MAIEQAGGGNLYGTFPVQSAVIDPAGPGPLVYRKSYLFDFQTGDLALDGAGRTIRTDGHTAWAQWLLKVGLTERFAHVIYSHQYGVELDKVPRLSSREEVEAHIARTITAGFKRSRLTGEVSNFAFDWDGQRLEVEFIVRPAVGPDVPMNLQVRY